MALGVRRERDRICNSLRGRNGMKITIGDRRIPANHHIVADLYLLLGKQNAVVEIAIMPNRDVPLRPDCEFHAIGTATIAQGQSDIALRKETFECIKTGNAASTPQPNIAR